MASRQQDTAQIDIAARKKIAEKLNKIRKNLYKQQAAIEPADFPCRRCFKMTSVASLKYRVCKTCRLGKEGIFKSLLKKLVAAGIDQTEAEIRLMKEIF